ncbi:DUF3887 domain-containing protein [Methanoculleus sp. 7T]|uniref:DUF3887 domain-containing protein n=1 Tax=Methanoculleus sp. 7T TaxID=2937282 RepID=UPI0020BF56E5|nr:DUF3887 domain-containing protein [Methanoculleus sp. 7T]MCK8517668.1 DUF3887 domain-containing protein [Methanoculleus sp. 7T]
MNLPNIPILAALVLLLAAAACGCTGQESVVSDEEAAQVLAYAEPVAENLLAGFNEDNYTMYSRDFSPEMKQALDEAAFEQNREFVTSRIGLYKSRANPVVTDDGKYVAVTYKGEFERENGVNLRFVFRKGDESHQLQGLWFNSPMLRS